MFLRGDQGFGGEYFSATLAYRFKNMSLNLPVKVEEKYLLLTAFQLVQQKKLLKKTRSLFFPRYCETAKKILRSCF